jgi:hypothetical protein
MYRCHDEFKSSMIKIGVRDELPKSANQLRREQLSKLPGNRKQMRF